MSLSRHHRKNSRKFVKTPYQNTLSNLRIVRTKERRNKPMYEKLLQELKDYTYFCGWKYETRNGSRTKVPKSVKGHNADNSNLDDFCGFSEIIGHIGKYDGIGIAITGDMAAIDIDHCIEDGKLSDMAEEIVSKVNTYTEISPSGTGIRLIGKTHGFNYDKEKYYINNRKYGLEVYAARDKGQFVTITGNAIGDKHVRDITDVLPEILEKYMCRPVLVKLFVTLCSINI